MEEKPVPEEISCGDQVFDIAFHTKANALATALIDGSIELWKYGIGDATNALMFKTTSHRSSCRGVEFAADGDKLFSISSDRSLQAIDGHGKQVLLYEGAHSCALNRLHVISEHAVATGDDAGEVKLWDIRVGDDAVMNWHVHEDFISGLCYNEERNTLLSVSGDATLGAYDMRSDKVFYRSDEQEAELQCVQVIKGGRKAICGTQDGVVLVFSWDRWGDCSDRYPGHPEGVDCMLRIDESTVLTGSSDGMIRVIAVQPNKILGIVGDHEEFPVEGLAISKDSMVLGSYAHDNVVRFWDVSMFAEDDGEEFDADDVDDTDNMDGDMRKVAAGGGGGSGGGGSNSNSNVARVRTSGNGKMGIDSGNATADIDGEEEDIADIDEEEEEEDEEWEEMDEDDEQLMEVTESSSSDNNNGDNDDDDDDDDDSDSSDDDERGGKKGPKRLPTAAEKFYADL